MCIIVQLELKVCIVVQLELKVCIVVQLELKMCIVVQCGHSNYKSFKFFNQWSNFVAFMGQGQSPHETGHSQLLGSYRV